MKLKNVVAIVIIIFLSLPVLIEALKPISIPNLSGTEVVLVLLIAVIITILLSLVKPKDLISNMQTKDRAKVKEVLNLINYNNFFPLEIAKPIDNVFKNGKANLALGVLKIDGEVKEYYVAFSNEKGSKLVDTMFTTTDKCKKPIIVCKDGYSKVDFIIRGPSGELVPLKEKDVKKIENINTYSQAYYTCSERKIIGYFLSNYQEELNENQEKTHEIVIYTKRPPCKYCNDLIEYYRSKYNPQLSLFIFDNLLLNLVSDNTKTKITFDTFEEAVDAVIRFENETLVNNKKYNEMNNTLQSVMHENKELVKMVEGYKNKTKAFVYKLKASYTSSPKREEVMKLSCTTENNNVGIPKEEFNSIWPENND